MNRHTPSLDDLDDQTRETINNTHHTTEHPENAVLPHTNTTPLIIEPDHELTHDNITTLADELETHEFSTINEETHTDPPRYRTTLVDETHNGLWQLNAAETHVVIHPDHPDHYHKPSLARIIHIIDNHVTSDNTTLTVTNTLTEQ